MVKIDMVMMVKASDLNEWKFVVKSDFVRKG